jgi:beta-aspartyl-peptidase (threonine type)
LPRPHRRSPLLVIHGGAGVERKDLSPAEEKAARARCGRHC